MGSVGYANSPGIPGDVPMNDVAGAAGPGGRSFEQMDEMGNPIAKKGWIRKEPEELKDLEVVQVSPGRTEARDKDKVISAKLKGSF